VLPLATRGQSVIIHTKLDNRESRWRPGMTVAAEVTLAQHEVPLAVREVALQRSGADTVVYVKEGERYEPHPVTLGARDGEFAEVLSGLDTGAVYVTEQSFLIKAELEKSAAGHEH
jgi:cobalt-zinc-cadmium efflux system membrane fusion protein